MAVLKVRYNCPVCSKEVNQTWDPFPADQQFCKVRCPNCNSQLLLTDTLCSTCTKHYRMSCLDIKRIKKIQVWLT
jgi:DNA-directed RNA polymerase subunit RPC12/RpoP